MALELQWGKITRQAYNYFKQRAIKEDTGFIKMFESNTKFTNFIVKTFLNIEIQLRLVTIMDVEKSRQYILKTI